MAATVLSCQHEPKRELTPSHDDARPRDALSADENVEHGEDSHKNNGENENDCASEADNGDGSNDDDNDDDGSIEDDEDESEELTSEADEGQPDKAIGTQALNYAHFNTRTVKSKRSARIFHACQACREYFCAGLYIPVR